MAGLSCGIVGLPNVGKSTLFNAITANQAPASNYPFCTIDPNVGVVEVNNPRLKVLSDISGSKKILHATVEFSDIAGLVKGASRGEGLGNQFLSHIRECSAIVHVVRCFASDDVVHVSGGINPIEDIETINLELILADFQTVEKILSKTEKMARGSKEMAGVCAVLQKIRDHLDAGKAVRTLELTQEEKDLAKPYSFLSAKKVLYVANVAEEDLPGMENSYVQNVREFAEKEGNLVIPISAKIEQEIAQLPVEERPEFLQTLGLEESGLDRLVRASFEMLGLITFITTGEMETRAWTIPEGTLAPEAAGAIHTDLQKGFIRAEVVSYEDMVACKGRVGAREAGRAKSEGKGYVVKDGDVILFYHN